MRSDFLLKCAQAAGEQGVKKAIISDIHGNLEALQAVLSDIKSQGITEIYCLGDVVSTLR